MAGVWEEIGSPDVNADELNERTAAGGLVPPGVYAAQLIGAKNTLSKQKETPGYELKFVVAAGPFRGAEVTDTLYRTENQRSKDRIALFAHRLGLLARDKDGKLMPMKGKTEFLDVLDTHTVIEVIHEEYDRDDGKKGHAVRLAFCGVHDPADAKVKAALSNGGQWVATEKKPGDKKTDPKKGDDKKPAEKKQRDLSDL